MQLPEHVTIIYYRASQTLAQTSLPAAMKGLYFSCIVEARSG